MKGTLYGNMKCTAGMPHLQVLCYSPADEYVIYGCLNGHIQDVVGCHSHIEYWQVCLPKYHCGKCGRQWESGDSIMEELWTATT